MIVPRLETWCMKGYETLRREREISTHCIGRQNLRNRIREQERLMGSTQFTTAPPGRGPFVLECGEWREL
jgi:hypothetical protein